MGCDEYFNMTKEQIYTCLIGEVNEKCVRTHGNATTYTSSVVKFLFFESFCKRSSFWGTGWTLEGKETAEAKAKPVLARLYTAVKNLPQGIKVDVISQKRDPRDNSRFIGSEAMVSVEYKVVVEVSAEYAQQYYKSLCDGNIVHDGGIYREFKQKAYSFYHRLKEQHFEIVEIMANHIMQYYQQKGYRTFNFYVYLDQVMRDDSIICCFKDYGMATLPSKEAAYGMAMLLVEMLTKNTQQKYRLSDYEYFVAVNKLLDPPPALRAW